jgi:hypothetical protein
MINLSFNIRNPFSDRWETLANPSWVISRHKAIELQFDRCTDIVGLCIRLTTRQDHAGVFVSASLLSYDAMFHFYDTRHWDKETNDWKQYD